MKICVQTAFLLLVGAMVLLPNSLNGGEKCKDKSNAQLESITLTGEVVSETKEKKDKNGNVETQTVYYVSTESGKIQLPGPSCKDKAENKEPTFTLGDYEGDTVMVTAQGYTKTGKDGAKAIHLVKLTEIKRIEA